MKNNYKQKPQITDMNQTAHSAVFKHVSSRNHNHISIELTTFAEISSQLSLLLCKSKCWSVKGGVASSSKIKWTKTRRDDTRNWFLTQIESKQQRNYTWYLLSVSFIYCIFRLKYGHTHNAFKNARTPNIFCLRPMSMFLYFEQNLCTKYSIIFSIHSLKWKKSSNEWRPTMPFLSAFSFYLHYIYIPCNLNSLILGRIFKSFIFGFFFHFTRFVNGTECHLN